MAVQLNELDSLDDDWHLTKQFHPPRTSTARKTALEFLGWWGIDDYNVFWVDAYGEWYMGDTKLVVMPRWWRPLPTPPEQQ